MHVQYHLSVSISAVLMKVASSEVQMATVLKLNRETDVSVSHFQRATVFDKPTHSVG